MLTFIRSHERSGIKGRVPRSTVGAWALSGAEAGFWLGTAFAMTAVAAVVLVSIGRGAPPGFATLGILDLSQAASSVGFILTVGAMALVVGCVVGTIAGLLIGTANGLLLSVLARTPQYRQADPACRRRAAAALVTASTAALWVATLSTWFGVGPGTARLLAVYVPAAAGSLVAARLSRTLPPVLPRRASERE